MLNRSFSKRFSKPQTSNQVLSLTIKMRRVNPQPHCGQAPGDRSGRLRISFKRRLGLAALLRDALSHGEDAVDMILAASRLLGALSRRQRLVNLPAIRSRLLWRTVDTARKMTP